MAEHPFFWDLVLIVVAVPVLEVAILRGNYRVLSPVTMFFFGIIVLYIIPYISHFYFSWDWRLGLLSYQQFKLAFNTLRFFLYTYCIIIIPLLYRLAKKRAVVMILDRRQIMFKAMFIFIVFCLILIVQQGVGVGFSPGAMLDRMLHPRKYTYIRAGVGPLTHLYGGMKFVLLAPAAAMIYLSGKRLRSIVFFLAAAFVTVIGGSKASFVLPLIMFSVIWQKMSWELKSIFVRIERTFQIGLIATLLVLAGFIAMPGREERVAGLKDAALRAVHYHKEAYYLPIVIEYFPWSSGYTIGQIRDTFIAPIPRAVWKGKPFVGLYARYFHPVFEPKAIYYHTSTFGCMAEAHMIFGRLGPFAYGIIWALFCYKLYLYMLSSNSLFKAFVVGMLSFYIYLLLRTGFLEVNASVILIYIFMGWTFFRNTKAVLEGETEYEESPLSESEQEWRGIDLPNTTNL